MQGNQRWQKGQKVSYLGVLGRVIVHGDSGGSGLGSGLLAKLLGNRLALVVHLLQVGLALLIHRDRCDRVRIWEKATVCREVVLNSHCSMLTNFEGCDAFLRKLSLRPTNLSF